MMMRLSLAVASLLALNVVAPATPQVERPFPLLAEPGSSSGLLSLRALPDALTELAGLHAVVLTDVPLPDGRRLALELDRQPIAAVGAALVVDGVVQVGRAVDDGISLWTGRVTGSSGGEVFLAFSPWGSRGWIDTGDGLVHLLAVPGPGGDWSSSQGLMVGEAELQALGVRPPLDACQTMGIPQPDGPARPREAGTPGPADGQVVLEARVVVETDHQFFGVFGSLPAARAYAVALLGAVSARYREQIDVILTIPYLSFYTTPADPWTSQDLGGNCIDVLYEFRDAWAGGAAPASGHLYHMLSGASLGCGVAWLNVLCDPEYGFSVSGNLSGQTPFPIQVGPLNWDFDVVAHEIGHNFNALHTHDYCPPLDECAPPGYFGACQPAQNCTDQGTIMSYCHLCDGGYLNKTTFFHPASVSDMRAAAEAGCLPPFSGLLTEDLGHAKPGSNGLPGLSGAVTLDPDLLHLDVVAAPVSRPGLLFLSPTLLLAPFKGGTLVPVPDVTVAVSSDGAGQLHLAGAATFGALYGVPLNVQIWFLDLAGFAATNGLRFEVIVP
jgi:hypothetical protein